MKVTKIVRGPFCVRIWSFLRNVAEDVLALCLHGGLFVIAELLVRKPIRCSEKLLNCILSMYFS